MSERHSLNKALLMYVTLSGISTFLSDEQFSNAASPIEVMRDASDYPLLSKKANSLKSLAGIFDSLADMVDTVPLDTLLDELLELSEHTCDQL